MRSSKIKLLICSMLSVGFLTTCYGATSQTCVVFKDKVCKTDGMRIQKDVDAVLTSINNFGKYESTTKYLNQPLIKLYPGYNDSQVSAADVAQKIISQVVNEEQANLNAILAASCAGTTIPKAACAFGPGPAKTVERALQKAEQTKEGLAKVFDYIRGSVYVNYEYTQKSLDQIKEKAKTLGAEIVVLKNRIENPTAEGYRDIQIFIKSKMGIIYEVQILGPSMSKNKKEIHKYYEGIREANAAISMMQTELDRVVIPNQTQCDLKIYPCTPEFIKQLKDRQTNLQNTIAVDQSNISKWTNASAESYAKVYRTDAITACSTDDIKKVCAKNIKDTGSDYFE